MTQGELAAPDYSIGYVSRIESGSRQPSDTVLAALASRLNVTVGHLLYGDTSVVAPVNHEELELAELALIGGEPGEALRRTSALLDSGSLRHAPELDRQARFIHARCHESLGDTHASIIELEDLLKVTPHGELSANIGIALTRCYRETEDYTSAIKNGERLLALLERHGFAGSDSYLRLMVTVASAYYDSDQLGAATRVLRRALASAEAADSSIGEGVTAWNTGMLSDLKGDLRSAGDQTRRALTLLEDTESPRNVARLRNQLATFIAQDPDGDLNEAARQADLAARELESSSASPLNAARSRVTRSRIALRQGRSDLAKQLLEAVPAGAVIDDSTLAAEVRVLQTAALASEGDLIDAAFDDASILLGLLGPVRIAGHLWFELGEIVAAAGDRRRSASCYREAALAMGAKRVRTLTSAHTGPRALAGVSF